MIRKIPENVKIDPSETRQNFKEINIKLFCCRYWILDEWDCQDLSVPFWRIYYNSIEGAKINYQNCTTLLNKKSLIVIPPNTAFTGMLNKDRSGDSENISGRKFLPTDDIAGIKKKNKVDHLFIHFSLGFPMDYTQPAIHTLKKSKSQARLIAAIQRTCIQQNHFGFFDGLKIISLISSCLLKLESSLPTPHATDPRIATVMDVVHRDYNKPISNAAFAAMVNLAPNSFARLFKNATGITIQQYIAKKRIENALNLIHHSDKNMDEIAHECGFSDRFHFSKSFKKSLHVSPAYYKKNLTLF